MTDRVLVTKDKKTLLPDNSPKAGILILRSEAHDLGLLDSADKPTQARRSTSDVKPAPQRRRTTKKG